MSVVFISHSDQVAANTLDEVLRRAFPNVEVFNTSRESSGLAAGENIDIGILNNIKRADALIWLASPASVVLSFWMAWELGVATAFSKAVIPARCFGLSPGKLPLLQGGRNAPDIGERDGLTHLLTSLRNHLDVTADRIAEVVNNLHSDQAPSPLWGQRNDSIVGARVLGKRIFVENYSPEDLAIIKAEIRDLGATAGLPIGALRTTLQAKERRVLQPENGWPGLENHEIYIEWSTPLVGRSYTHLPLEVDEQ